jgi:hypothetical protein
MIALLQIVGLVCNEDFSKLLRLKRETSKMNELQVMQEDKG